MHKVTILLNGKRRIVIENGTYQCEARVQGQWCLVDSDFPEVTEPRYATIIKAMNGAEYSLAA